VIVCQTINCFKCEVDKWSVILLLAIVYSIILNG
jgi:hypothetical protein